MRPATKSPESDFFIIYDFSNSYNLILSILIATIKYHLKTYDTTDLPLFEARQWNFLQKKRLFKILLK